jgi:hypothetical protein
MRIWVIFFCLLFLSVAAISSLAGQAGGGKRNRWGEPSDDDPKYNLKSEVTASGVVEKVGDHRGRRGTPRTEITLKTPAGIIEANLGPAIFLEENKLKLVKGDAVIVTGSQVSTSGGERILAREVRKASQTVVLRSPDGQPRWEQRHR